MAETDRPEKEQEDFVQLLTSCQGRLYAYVRTLVPDADAARDILQNTNLVLWRKSHEFTPGTNFGAWACKTALYQVMAWRRDSGRDLLVFDEALLGQLAQAAEQRSGMADRLQDALRRCLKKLSDAQRSLLQNKYDDQEAVQSIADRQQRTPNAVSRSLFRIRQTLLLCIEENTAKEGAE